MNSNPNIQPSAKESMMCESVEQSENKKTESVREMIRHLNKGHDTYFKMLGKIADGDNTASTRAIFERVKTENQQRDLRLYQRYREMLRMDYTVASMLGIRVPQLKDGF